MPEFVSIDDAYGDSGSVELSHREGLGYSTIKSYSGETDTLNFSFLKPQDSIDLIASDMIDTISINSVNMRYAMIKGPKKYNYIINVNTKIIDFILSLKKFIKNNNKNIEKLNFQNINNELFSKNISKICNQYGIEYTINELYNNDNIKQADSNSTNKKL